MARAAAIVGLLVAARVGGAIHHEAHVMPVVGPFRLVSLDPAPRRSCAAFHLTERASPVRVIDVSLFNGEVALLAAKVQELWGALDGLVVAEANETFSGRPKRFAFPTTHGLRGWAHNEQIHLPGGQVGWDREGDSRRIAAEAAIRQFGLLPQDMLLLSDIDEIVSRNTVWLLQHCDVPADAVVLPLRWHSYSLRWQQPVPWMSLVAVRVKAFLCNPAALSHARRVRWAAFRSGSNEGSVRPCVGAVQVLPFDGWHLSNFLSPQQLAHKLEAFSHAEYSSKEFADVARLEECVRGGHDYVGRPIMDLLPSTPSPSTVPKFFDAFPEQLEIPELVDREQSWWKCHGPLLRQLQ
jgi:hypothetical protein